MLRLKEIRSKLGISQQILAKCLNLHQATISQYELGKRKLTADIIVKICLLLETTPNDLLDFHSAYSKYTDELIRMRSEYEKEKII